MIPLSPDELTRFVPGSLTNLVGGPSFTFRPANPRLKRKYSHALTAEGLRYHTQDRVEAETLKAVRGLWIGDEEALLATETRLQAFWETMRQAATDPSIVVDEGEAAAVSVALTQILDNWPALRLMNADNQRFNEDAPKIALGMFLAGWTGIDLPFRLVADQVPLEALDAVEEKIDAIEKEAMAADVEGVIGVAFQELAIHALSLMNLNGDTEKNSPSPSSPQGSPDGSTAVGSAANDRNDASANSGSAPAKPSPSTKKPATS